MLFNSCTSILLFHLWVCWSPGGEENHISWWLGEKRDPFGLWCMDYYVLMGPQRSNLWPMQLWLLPFKRGWTRVCVLNQRVCVCVCAPVMLPIADTHTRLLHSGVAAHSTVLKKKMLTKAKSLWVLWFIVDLQLWREFTCIHLDFDIWLICVT